MGCTVKLLAIAEEIDGEVSARVHAPAMVPDAHPLAEMTEAYNAVFVEGDAVPAGFVVLRPRGRRPLRSAVLGDLVAVARARAQGARGVGCVCCRRVRGMADVDTQYYVALDVAGRPGVLAQVVTVFAEHGVSIRSVLQRGKGEEAKLVLVTTWPGRRGPAGPRGPALTCRWSATWPAPCGSRARRPTRCWGGRGDGDTGVARG